MFDHRVSFSLYMAHGGTTFGGWVGCRNPFIPNVTSYDFEAPINENGRANPSYAKYRARAMRHLNEGETVPDPPADIPTKAYGTVAMSRRRRAGYSLSTSCTTSDTCSSTESASEFSTGGTAE